MRNMESLPRATAVVNSRRLFGLWALILLAVFALSPGREPSAGEAAGLFVPGGGLFAPGVMAANWLARAHGAAVAALVIAAVTANGHVACSLTSPGATGVLRWLAGLPLLSLTVLGFGLAGLWFPPILLAACAASLPALPWSRIRLPRPPVEWSAGPRTGEISPFTVGLAALPALLVLPAALAPETAFDSLRYHLALPAGWLAAHRVHHVSRLLFSSFPSGSEMLYGLCLSAGSIPAAKLLNWLFLPAASVLLFTRARGPLGKGPALALSVAACASPFFGRMAGFCNADLGLMTLAFGALLAALDRRFLLAGILFGAACGVKYLGAFAFASCAAALLLARGAGGAVTDAPAPDAEASGPATELPASARAGGGKFLLRAGPVALVFFLPWGLRNLLDTGNPVYPYFMGGFDLEPATVERHLRYAADWRGTHPFWSAWLTLFPTVLSRGIYEGTAELLSPVFLSALGVAALCRNLPASARICGAFAAVIWATWAFAGGGVVRFLLPAAFPAGLFLAHALARLAIPRRVLIAGLAAALAVQLPFLFAAQRRFSDPAPVLAGFESDHDYLNRVIEPTGRRLPAMERACASLPAGKVLMLGDPQAFYSRCPALTEFEFAPPLLVRLAADSTGIERMRIRLRQRRITGFLYRAEGMVSVARMYGLDAPPAAFARLAEFWAGYAEPLWTFEKPAANNFYHCYALRERPGKLRPPQTLLWFNLPGTEEVTNDLEHLIDAKRFLEAEVLAEKAVARYPGLPTAWHRLWLAARGAGDKATASRAASAVRRLGYGALLTSPRP